jgi:putative ABC transport system substrate-binding protein
MNGIRQQPQRRRLILAATACSALLGAGTVLGKSTKPPARIGWLLLYTREAGGQRFAAFKEALAALGWNEGSNVVIEERWANGHRNRLQPLAEDLAAHKPALIVAVPAAAAAVAARAAPRTPIVAAGVDLVGVGLAKSLARPGGMVTGVSTLRTDLAEKYLELLLATASRLERVGFLADPNSPVHPQSMNAARRSAAQFRVEAHIAEARRAEEIEAAVARLAQAGAQALIVLPSAAFLGEAGRIAKLALSNRWPTISGDFEMAEAGALLSYAGDVFANYRRLAYYVDRILKGAKPQELPIELPTKFGLVVNLRTAKELGITIPQSILVRADRVIE